MKTEIDLRKKKNFPDTIRTYCSRQGPKGYSSREKFKIICNANSYRFKSNRPEDLKDKKCLYQETIKGDLLCRCNDIKAEYDSEMFKENEIAKRREAFGVYLGITKEY